MIKEGHVYGSQSVESLRGMKWLNGILKMQGIEPQGHVSTVTVRFCPKVIQTYLLIDLHWWWTVHVQKVFL